MAVITGYLKLVKANLKSPLAVSVFYLTLITLLYYAKADYPFYFPLGKLYFWIIQQTDIGTANFYWNHIMTHFQLIMTIAVVLLGLRLFRMQEQDIGWKRPETSVALKILVGMAVAFFWGTVHLVWRAIPHICFNGKLPAKWGYCLKPMVISMADSTTLVKLGFFWLYPSVAEEIFFRGFLYTILRKIAGVRQAVLISAILYSLSHFHFCHSNVFTLDLFVYHFFHGILYALLYKWDGTLWSPIAAHCAFNFLSNWFIRYYTY